MKKGRLCLQCHRALPGGAPEGLCPACLLKLGSIELGVDLELPHGQRQIQRSKSEVPNQKEQGQNPKFNVQSPEVPVDSKPMIAWTCGSRFGNYEVLERIGRGGMGAVYKARQLSLDRVVALKLLPLGPWSGVEAVQRFQTEARAAAALQHPNIVAVHDVGEQDDQPFFSMDFVEGPTLAELVRDQPLRSERAAAYLKTIAEAVQYAHEQGILHRDLKPSNILIDAADQPRITDFGLAKRLQGDSDLTLTGEVLGSPNFISPEQAEGRSGAIGPASDVYSLGALLYHLLTRQPPFQADTLTTLLKHVLEADPVPPHLLNPNIPEDLETICLKCLEKEPARRYASARDLANDLARFLRNEPISARAIGPMGKAWKWCRRRPALAALSVSLALALFAGAITVWSQLQRTRASELLARQNAYAADMNLAQAAVQSGDLGAAINLLNAHRPSRDQIDLRGWEWRYLWNCSRSDELFELTRLSTPADGLAFTSDGRHLAVRDRRGSLTLWDFTSRQLVSSNKMSTWGTAFAVSKHRSLLAYVTGNEPAVTILNLDTGREIGRLPCATNIAHLAFSIDETKLLTASVPGKLTWWDIASGQPTSTCDLPVEAVPTFPLAFCRERALIAYQAEYLFGFYEMNSGRQIQFKLPSVENCATALTFSPDGQWLAAGIGLSNSEVQVWAVEDIWQADGERSPIRGNLGTRRDNDLEVDRLQQASGVLPPPRYKLGPHRDWILDLAFSPDGRALACAGADSTLRVWELSRPEACRAYRGHTHQILSVAWSPEGKLIASTGTDGSVRLWDPWREPTVNTLPTFSIPVALWCFRLSPDGQQAIAVNPSGTAALWDTVKKRRLEALDFLGTRLRYLAWSLDGKKVAVADQSGNVTAWDWGSRRAIFSARLPDHRIRDLRFSNDGRFFSCVGLPETALGARVIRAWDLKEGRELPLPKEAMAHQLRGLSFSPDWHRLATTSARGALEIWDLPGGRCRTRATQPFTEPDEPFLSVAFSPDQQILASATTRGVLAFWDAELEYPPAIISRTAQEVYGLAFSTDGSRLLVGGKRSADVVRLLDVKSQRFVAALSGRPDKYRVIGMSADDSTIYAVGDETALVWRAPSWEEIENVEKAAGLQ